MLTDACLESTRVSSQGHSELIIDTYTDPWENSLPNIIESIVIRPECDAEARAMGERIHREFLEAYGLNEADPNAPPLLFYDPAKAEDPFTPYDSEAPFRKWPP